MVEFRGGLGRSGCVVMGLLDDVYGCYDVILSLRLEFKTDRRGPYPF